MQGIEHRLVVETQIRGDAGGAVPAGAGQENLAATQDKGVRGAQALLQGGALLLGERSNKGRRSHADQRTTFSFEVDPARRSSPLDRIVTGVQDAGFNDFFPRAVLTGRAAFPFSLFAGDLSAVEGTCDYVGINVYARDLVAFDPRSPTTLFGRRFAAPGAPRGDSGVNSLYGEIYPAGIARVARRVAAFGKPIYVTENGVADRADRLRPWLLASAVRAMHDALADGIDLRGYFHWSLVDNFEWDDGWGMRFGLVALDEKTQQRTMRASGELYSAIAHANGLTLAMLLTYAPDAVDPIVPSA